MHTLPGSLALWCSVAFMYLCVSSRRINTIRYHTIGYFNPIDRVVCRLYPWVNNDPSWNTKVTAKWLNLIITDTPHAKTVVAAW